MIALERILALCLPAVGVAGCCAILGLSAENSGPRLEEKADGLYYTLDEIVPHEGSAKLYNPGDVRFASPPSLEPLNCAATGVGALPYDPERALPEGAQVIRHTAEVGFVNEPPIRSESSKDVTLSLSGGAAARSVPVRFTVERIAHPLHMVRLAYHVAALPWTGPLPPGVPPRPEGYFDPKTRWITRQEPAVRLPGRELTRKVIVRAYVQRADFESSGFDCPIELGRAIHARSTPIFGELYYGLRGLSWNAAERQ